MRKFQISWHDFRALTVFFFFSRLGLSVRLAMALSRVRASLAVVVVVVVCFMSQLAVGGSVSPSCTSVVPCWQRVEYVALVNPGFEATPSTSLGAMNETFLNGSILPGWTIQSGARFGVMRLAGETDNPLLDSNVFGAFHEGPISDFVSQVIPVAIQPSARYVVQGSIVRARSLPFSPDYVIRLALATVSNGSITVTTVLREISSSSYGIPRPAGATAFQLSFQAPPPSSFWTDLALTLAEQQQQQQQEQQQQQLVVQFAAASGGRVLFDNFALRVFSRESKLVCVSSSSLFWSSPLCFSFSS
jgi:hypothetical protein